MKVSAQEIDALLPQTQCGECGYPGCMPYAQALAAGLANINLCPPGGVDTLNALGAYLHIDTTQYIDNTINNTRMPTRAVIDEVACIGCTKCIQACPVDAIIGHGKLMHTVLTDECTGCGLCVEPCPVDCIEMISIPKATYDKTTARIRFNARKIRILREEQAIQQAYRTKKTLAMPTESELQDKTAKQDYIIQALNRIKAKKLL